MFLFVQLMCIGRQLLYDILKTNVVVRLNVYLIFIISAVSD